MATLPPGRAARISLVDTAHRVADVAQAESDADNAECVAGDRQSLRVAFDQDQAALCTILADLAFPEYKHLTAKVGTDYASPALRGAVIGQGKVRRAGAAVEYGHSRLGGNLPGCVPPPGAVNVQA